MRLIFVSGLFPWPSQPATGTFVQEFAYALARQGHQVTVLSPVGVFVGLRGGMPARMAVEDAGEGAKIRVFRPRYVSYSSKRIFRSFHTGRLSHWAFRRAAIREIGLAGLKGDAVYGHFMYPSGGAALAVARRLQVAGFVGVGEGEFWTIEPVGAKHAMHEMLHACGILAVSTYIAHKLERELLIPRAKILVEPNGVDRSCFHPNRDRDSTARRLGIPVETFNIGYVGPFVSSKGYPQLRAALNGFDQVRFVLLGRGNPPAHDPQIAFAGTVPHREVAEYLAACDLFILPTALEGSCNAVIEAMACGLPIVTSRGEFMDDLVGADCALRVDPASPAEIRAAVVDLMKSPEKRQELAAASIKRAERFDIDKRAMRVGNWIERLRPKC